MVGAGPGRLIRPEDPGTPEQEWCSYLGDRPELDLPTGRVVVVAPHPDDETLGAGGLISTAARRGSSVSVISCTDGEAASSVPDLGAIRRIEMDRAMAALTGVATLDVTRLGLPDGELPDHLVPLRSALLAPIGEAALVVAPWLGDGHPDHHAVGSVCLDLCTELRRPVIQFPVWAWHWGRPGCFGEHEVVNLPLDRRVRARKRAALRCHASQTDGSAAILTPHVLEHFDRSIESFVVPR